MNSYSFTALIPLLPLAGFVLLGLLGIKYFKNASGVIATVLILISASLAIDAAYNYFFVSGKLNSAYQTIIPFQYHWLPFSQTMSIDMGIIVDPISVMMMVVITFVSL